MEEAGGKITPKNVYRYSFAQESACRLCKSVGDPAHRFNFWGNTCRVLLVVAEQLYGQRIQNVEGLPRLHIVERANDGFAISISSRPQLIKRSLRGHEANGAAKIRLQLNNFVFKKA